MKRNCRKIGITVIVAGLGIIAARCLPESFCLIAIGIIMVVLGILLIRRW